MIPLLLFGLFSFVKADPWPSTSHNSTEDLFQATQNGHALVVSIEKYSSISNVPGAVQNGQDWYSWLTQYKNIAEENIHFLQNEMATKEDILSKAQEIGQASQADELIWFVFVGKGTSIQKSAHSLLFGGDIEPNQQSMYERSVLQSQVLQELEQNGAQVLAIIDSKNSVQGIYSDAMQFGLESALSKNSQSNLTTILTAGALHSISSSLSDVKRPIFSHLLLQGFQGGGDMNQDGIVTPSEALEYCKNVLLPINPFLANAPTLIGNKNIKIPHPGSINKGEPANITNSFGQKLRSSVKNSILKELSSVQMFEDAAFSMAKQEDDFFSKPTNPSMPIKKFSSTPSEGFEDDSPGKQLFHKKMRSVDSVKQSCQNCHGTLATSDFTHLYAIVPAMTDEQLGQSILRKKGYHPSYEGKLSEEELGEIISFIREHFPQK